jgi:aspartyl-tRNA(Asn)/glutamyl-tRNA(Gln) amidotransferase subunit C
MELPPHGPDEVRRIAALARIRLEDSEVESLSRDFGRILGYVTRLTERDEADGAEPLIHAVVTENPAVTLRKDEAGTCLPPGTLLELAPDREGEFVRVPRVLEEGR